MKLQLWTLCRKLTALVVFVILVDVSQHALAVVVQAYEGMESVTLPCQYSGVLAHVVSVVWSRSDHNPTVIHRLNDNDYNIKEEYSYRERTSLKSNALDSGDFSLTLRKPELSDSSSYTCSIRMETWSGSTEELRLTQVRLQVKDDHKEVQVQKGAESILIPCGSSADLPEDTRVEWTHSDPGLTAFHVVPVHQNKTDDLQTQDKFCSCRTYTSKDLSLTLKYPTDRDAGTYICTVYWKGDILRHKVLLQVVKDVFGGTSDSFMTYTITRAGVSNSF